jgi:hypothetical protein
VPDLAAAHRQLKELTLTRGADAATAALVRHIRRAPDQLIAYAHEHGPDDLNGPPWQAVRPSHFARSQERVRNRLT